jgi:hypothetical protein
LQINLSISKYSLLTQQTLTTKIIGYLHLSIATLS